MASPPNTIIFPIDQLKAETLRAIAKDLNVASGGRKEDLINRLRTSSASGPDISTAAKRKADTRLDSPSTGKKLKTPQSERSMKTCNVPTSGSIPPDQNPDSHVDEANQEMVDDNGNTSQKEPAFDDYFVSGTTSVFVTGDDLVHLMGGRTASVDGLWKLVFPEDAKAENRFHHWVVHGSLENVSAFHAVCRDLFKKERAEKEPTLENAEGEDTKKGEKSDATYLWWYELSVSRQRSQGALKIELQRGQATVVDGISPRIDMKEEEGTFWLSDPRAAKPDDTRLLDQTVHELFRDDK